MNKRIRINFSETTKDVKADTTIEYEFNENETFKKKEDILKEAKDLFEEAQNFAKIRTLQK